MFPTFYMLLKKKVSCSGFRCGEIGFVTVKGINQFWEFVKRLKIHTKPAVN
jgi:hypothetical protein